jgi:hypothetical protein
MKGREILGAALLALVAGCQQEATEPSTVSAGAGGRNVKAVVYGNVFVQPQEDQLIVSLTGHQLVIEKDRLLVDKNEAATFPDTAKDFTVACSNGALHVTADGVAVLSTVLGK